MENEIEYHTSKIKDTNFELIHADRNGINVSIVEEEYKAKYVGEFAVKTKNGGWCDQAVSVFYQETPYPGGSNYFGLYYMYSYANIVEDTKPSLYITDAISAVSENGIPLVYTAIVADDDKALYSAYHHDYQTYKDVMIDGGREYTRYSGSKFITFEIINGEIVLHNEQQ